MSAGSGGQSSGADNEALRGFANVIEGIAGDEGQDRLAGFTQDFRVAGQDDARPFDGVTPGSGRGGQCNRIAGVQAIEFAEESPLPDPSTLYDYLYSEIAS